MTNFLMENLIESKIKMSNKFIKNVLFIVFNKSHFFSKIYVFFSQLFDLLPLHILNCWKSLNFTVNHWYSEVTGAIVIRINRECLQRRYLDSIKYTLSYVRITDLDKLNMVMLVHVRLDTIFTLATMVEIVFCPNFSS